MHIPGYKEREKRQPWRKVAVVVGVLLVVVVLVIVGGRLLKSGPEAAIDGGKYQAVFFTNGQVYFGKLSDAGNGYFSLKDIFYLQAKNAGSVTKDGSQNPQQTADGTAADVELIKLGNEIHGPQDEMIISKEQVLFFENLKPDGKVADSIAKYKKQ